MPLTSVYVLLEVRYLNKIFVRGHRLSKPPFYGRTEQELVNLNSLSFNLPYTIHFASASITTGDGEGISLVRAWDSACAASMN